LEVERIKAERLVPGREPIIIAVALACIALAAFGGSFEHPCKVAVNPWLAATSLAAGEPAGTFVDFEVIPS